MHRHHGFGIAAFARAVVHDRGDRPQSMHHDRGIRTLHAMMQSQEQPHRRQPRVRAHQLEFHIAGQIAQMRGMEAPKGDVTRHRHRIFHIVVERLEIGAFGIGFVGTGQRARRYDVASRGDDPPVHSSERNAVARFRHCVLTLRM